MRLFGKRNRPLRVAVLGSGPAGLFAAQAVYDTGNVVSIFSRGERSALHGAQYLHAPVPGFDCGKPATVNYILKGTVEDYRRKVYGSWDSDVQVSPEALAPQHLAWNIRSVYDQAWDRFGGLISRVEITPQWLNGGILEGFDLVVWSIPLARFCNGSHQFRAKNVWAQGDAPELDQWCSVAVEPWTIVTNAEEYPRWYRASNVFGYKTAEWPAGVKPPINGLVSVDKPIDNNCSCWSQWNLNTPVIRVGRFGTWTKSELSHMAYEHTRAALAKM